MFHSKKWSKEWSVLSCEDQVSWQRLEIQRQINSFISCFRGSMCLCFMLESARTVAQGVVTCLQQQGNGLEPLKGKSWERQLKLGNCSSESSIFLKYISVFFLPSSNGFCWLIEVILSGDLLFPFKAQIIQFYRPPSQFNNNLTF